MSFWKDDCISETKDEILAAIEKGNETVFSELIRSYINNKNEREVSKEILEYISAKKVEKENFKTITGMIEILRKHLFKTSSQQFAKLQNFNVYDAIKNNSLNDVQSLINSGSNVNLLDENGWNYLHHVVIQNNYEIIKYNAPQNSDSCIR